MTSWVCLRECRCLVRLSRYFANSAVGFAIHGFWHCLQHGTKLSDSISCWVTHETVDSLRTGLALGDVDFLLDELFLVYEMY